LSARNRPAIASNVSFTVGIACLLFQIKFQIKT
jgi:hypothetical protein